MEFNMNHEETKPPITKLILFEDSVSDYFLEFVMKNLEEDEGIAFNCEKEDPSQTERITALCEEHRISLSRILNYSSEKNSLLPISSFEDDSKGFRIHSIIIIPKRLQSSNFFQKNVFRTILKELPDSWIIFNNFYDLFSMTCLDAVTVSHPFTAEIIRPQSIRSSDGHPHAERELLEINVDESEQFQKMAVLKKKMAKCLF